MSSIVNQIRNELKSLADEKIRASGQRFFKEEVQMYGVKTNIVSKIAKENFKALAQADKQEIFAVCDSLWQSGIMEESFIACQLSHFLHKQYVPSDFGLFESWLHQYVNNWASCDTLCNHTLGTFISMYPEFIPALKSWTKSYNRWVRRGAAVTLIIPARKGEFLDDVFQIADLLLTDPDDMVQKGYGWMLKVSGQAHQMEIFNYVMEKKDVMPRTALRYAIEKLPADLKKQAMMKKTKMKV